MASKGFWTRALLSHNTVPRSTLSRPGSLSNTCDGTTLRCNHDFDTVAYVLDGRKDFRSDFLDCWLGKLSISTAISLILYISFLVLWGKWSFSISKIAGWYLRYCFDLTFLLGNRRLFQVAAASKGLDDRAQARVLPGSPFFVKFSICVRGVSDSGR